MAGFFSRIVVESHESNQPMDRTTFEAENETSILRHLQHQRG